MDLAVYISSQVALVAVALGAIYFIARTIGSRIDSVETGLHSRIDDLGRRIDNMEARLGRVEERVDSLHATMAEFGERLTRHEHTEH